MKNLKTLAIFLLAAAVLSSCGGLNKMVKDSDLVSYSVAPEVLAMHGGEVNANITVNYPAKYFNKKAVVTLIQSIFNFYQSALPLDNTWKYIRRAPDRHPC